MCDRPPLRRYFVQTVDRINDDNVKLLGSHHLIDAHMYFNNTARGEGYIFRRYIDGTVRTEKVAEFEPGVVSYVVEVGFE